MRGVAPREPFGVFRVGEHPATWAIDERAALGRREALQAFLRWRLADRIARGEAIALNQNGDEIPASWLRAEARRLAGAASNYDPLWAPLVEAMRWSGAALP